MRNRWPILALLCVLASLLVPGIASAHSAAGAENRVWAFDLAGQVHVAGAAALTLDLHQRSSLAEYDSASGSLLAAKGGGHKNSLDYVGETHVYRIKGPNGTYKIGESAQGVRVRNGTSIRGEQQARRLTRETGTPHRSDIRKTFPDKRSAREYETRLIERFRRMFGDDALPGNKTNR